MKILITGATGKIGINLVNHLIKEHSIATISRQTANGPIHTKEYLADITDYLKISKIVADFKPEVIIHLASLVGDKCEISSDLTNEINIIATEKLYTLALENKVKQFIFTSTSAVYTQNKLLPTKEEENIYPQNEYGNSKLKAEKSLEALFSEKSNITILRLFNVYGSDFNKSLIYKLTHPSTNKLGLFDPKKYYRDYIHIDDVLQAIDKCIEIKPKGYNIFNIGSGKAYSTEELIKILKVDTNLINMELLPLKKLDITWADISKAKTLLKFKPNNTIVIDD